MLGRVISISRIFLILYTIEGFFRDLEIARPKINDLIAKNKIPVIRRNYANRDEGDCCWDA